MNDRIDSIAFNNNDDGPRLDRSIAYEMINDFGELAFSEVVYRYQNNMASNLKQLAYCLEQEDQKEILWALQYIRNCSAQLGIIGVANQCNTALKHIVGNRLAAVQHDQFETTISESVALLCSIESEMQSEK